MRRKDVIDPFRKVLLDPLKVDHLRETPVKDMFDLTDWALRMSPRTRVGTFFDGMSSWNKMNTMDGEQFARLTAHFPNVEWEEVARVPYEINELLWKLHPDLLEDEERFDKWLGSDSGRPFAVPKAYRRPFTGRQAFKLN